MPDSEEERLFCRLISDKHAGKIKTNIEIRQHLINLKIKVPGQTCLNKIIKSYETRNSNDIRDSVGVSKTKVANSTCSTQSSALSIDKNEKEYKIESFNNFKILGLIDEGPYIKNFIAQRVNDAAIFVKESGYNVSNIVGHI
uniref:BRCT domain-containing protein n=1 Tax=Strongyloides papillosus TaxID=174720 RepID=A0A0N5CJ02_STREA